MSRNRFFYRGHNASREKAFKAYVAGQKRSLSAAIKRAFRPRSVERIIGHLKNERRSGRNHLTGSRDDAAYAVVVAVDYNVRLLILWIGILRDWISAAIRSDPELSKPLQND